MRACVRWLLTLASAVGLGRVGIDHLLLMRAGASATPHHLSLGCGGDFQ
jgi:hypothetical protein